MYTCVYLTNMYTGICIPGEFFEFNVRPSRGHQYKLYKQRNVSCVRSTFFSERLVNVWNSLADILILVHFLGLSALFNESVLTNFLNVFSVMMFYVFYVFLLCAFVCCC